MKDAPRVMRPAAARTTVATGSVLTTPRSPWSAIQSASVPTSHALGSPLTVGGPRPVRPKTAPNSANQHTHCRRGHFVVPNPSERSHDEAQPSRPRTHEGSRHSTDSEKRVLDNQKLQRYRAMFVCTCTDARRSSVSARHILPRERVPECVRASALPKAMRESWHSCARRSRGRVRISWRGLYGPPLSTGFACRARPLALIRNGPARMGPPLCSVIPLRSDWKWSRRE
jgi:hypothetical protein